MMTDGEWSIVFYVVESGASPVEEFLEGLDLQTKVLFEWSIEQLRVRNTSAREPLVRHLQGMIWELRRESNRNIYRLLYCFLPGRRVLFLHGFQKTTQKTPRREITTAQQRLNRLTQRQGGEL